MKIVITQNHLGVKYREITEFEDIELSMCWDNGNSDGIPTHLFLNLYSRRIDELNKKFEDGYDFSLFGYYKLDGTEETYLAAVKNYNSIIDKLLEKDYFEVEDLENFEMY